MISIIMTYFDKNLLDNMNEIGEEHEIIVPDGLYKNHENIKKIKADSLNKFITIAFKKSIGERIVFIGSVIDIQTLKKLIKQSKNADVVYLKRKKHSFWAKIFVHLVLPKSRKFSDPLSQIFVIKSDVIKQIDLMPIGQKIFLEILAKGYYKKIEEISSNIRHNFNENYRDYSKYLFKIAWHEGEIFRWIKFGVVGVTSILINEIVLWLMIQKFDILTSGFIGVETSILWSFIFNDLWTFRDRGSRSIAGFFKRMLKFNVVSAFGILINVVVLIFFNTLFGMNPLKANLLGIAAAFVWNFMANNLWTWFI